MTVADLAIQDLDTASDGAYVASIVAPAPASLASPATSGLAVTIAAVVPAGPSMGPAAVVPASARRMAPPLPAAVLAGRVSQAASPAPSCLVDEFFSDESNNPADGSVLDDLATELLLGNGHQRSRRTT